MIKYKIYYHYTLSSALSSKRSRFQSENKEAQQAGDAQEGEGEEEGQEDAKDASQEDEEEDDVIYQVIPRQADEGMYTWVSGMGFVGVGLMWETHGSKHQGVCFERVSDEPKYMLMIAFIYI